MSAKTESKSSTCSDIRPQVDGERLNCTLPADHAEPQEGFPQGTPHQDGTTLDELTGKPFRWWGLGPG